MADSIDYSSFAGDVGFPRNPSDLVSTSQCPACFTPLRSTVCASCGLNLGHPAASELHELSLATAASLDKRLDIIGRIRYDTHQTAVTERAAELQRAAEVQRARDVERAAALASTRAAAIPAPVEIAAVSPSPVSPAPVAPAPVAPAPVVAAPPVAAPTVPMAPPTEPTHPAPPQPSSAGRRKHSSVQITLLVVGISLLSVAAIFFLVYAFINFGIIWRSVIIAAITVAAIVTASLLRRRKMTATAEGIAVFGVVLIYLDAFAIRANDFFSLAAPDGRIYWGATIVASSVVFILWHRLSALRTPSIVGFSAFAPGVGVLVAGLARDGDVGTRAFLVVAAIATAGLVHRLALPSMAATSNSTSKRTIERIVSLSTTTLALTAGFFIAFTVAPNSDWSGTIAVVALSVIAAVHLVVIAPPSTTQPMRTFAYIFGGMGAVFAASAGGMAAPRIATVTFLVLAPAIAAAVVALTLEAFALRGSPAWKRFSTVAAWCAAAVLALTLLAPVYVAAAWTLLVPAAGIAKFWTLVPTDAVSTPEDYNGWAVLSLTIIGLLTTASWVATKVIRKRGPLLAWFGAGVLVAAGGLSPILWPTVLNWLGIATIAVALLNVKKARETMAPAYRTVLIVVAMVTGVLGYLVSWASTSTWWIGSIVAIGLLLVSRRIVVRKALKAVLLGIATVLVLVASHASALHITHSTSTPFDVTSMDGVRFASITAVALFTIFALPLARFFTVVDRRLMFWLTGVLSVLLLTATSGGIGVLSEPDRLSLLLPEYLTSLLVSLVLLIGVVLWIAVPTRQTLKPERLTACIATAPATYFAIVAVTKTVSLPEFVNTVAPVASALLVAAVALTFAVVKPSSTPRWALDISVVLVGLPSVVFAVIVGGEFAWFVLVLGAVTVLFLAINSDGLFNARSWRKHLGWLAIALATAGLWWRLGSNNIRALEPYVLPLAGVLLVTALLIARSEARRKRLGSADGESEPAALAAPSRSAAPLVALGGLLVAILPLGVNAITGSLTRAIVVAASSAALLLLGSLVASARHPRQPGAASIRWQPWLDVAALAGALGVIVTSIGRAMMTSPSEWSRDVWLAAALLVLIAAGIGQTSTARSTVSRLRNAGSVTLAVIPLVGVLAVEANALTTPDLGMYRALGLIALFATVTTVSFLVNRVPFGVVVAWVSTAGWAIASAVTLMTFPHDVLPSLAPVSSALLVGAIALASTLMRPQFISRWMLDLGVILVGAISVVVSLGQNTSHTWLVLLIAAVVVLLIAIDGDGLFSSSSGRRHLGWVSLALATGGLWWRLSESEVKDLEPYVLPLAGALLVIALLLQRATSKAAEAHPEQRTQAAPLIALGGLIVGILPLAVNAASGTQLRAVIIAGVSALLLLAGSFVIGSRAAQRWWDAAGLAGAIGVIVLMIGRAMYLPVSDGSRDAWIVGAFVLLIAAAFGQAVSRHESTDRIRAIASQSLGLMSMVAVVALEIPAFEEPTLGHIRVMGLVLLFAAVHVISLTLHRPPLSPLVGWIAIGLAGAAALVGISVDVVDPRELVTVPIALALLATGTMHMREVATARSWPWLAPGVILLLVPSLLEAFNDQVPWRIVGLGVVGVAVIIIGVVRRLQAPFVIGVVVVLIHGISTFLPQLRAAYEFVPWWLWLGVAGVILTALAARYEQRIRDLKTVALKFAALR